MPDKDIEKELKESADKITVKSFSERWNNLEARLSDDEANQKILVESPYLITNENNAVQSTNNRQRNLLIAALSFAVCIIIVLSIVLPLTLRKEEPAYFAPTDIPLYIVKNDQFFDALNDNGVEFIDLSGYEIEDCIVFVTLDGEFKGGECTVVNEEWLMYITFYDFSVDPLGFDYFEFGYEVYNVGSTEIKYSTEVEETTYITDARARFKNYYYKLYIISLYDNRYEIYEKLFA